MDAQVAVNWNMDVPLGATNDKAITLLKSAIARPHDEYEDLGRVTAVLLSALNLQPGQYYART